MKGTPSSWWNSNRANLVTKFVSVTSPIKKQQWHSSFYSTIDHSIGTLPTELIAPETTSPNFSKRKGSISNISWEGDQTSLPINCTSWRKNPDTQEVLAKSVVMLELVSICIQFLRLLWTSFVTLAKLSLCLCMTICHLQKQGRKRKLFSVCNIQLYLLCHKLSLTQQHSTQSARQGFDAGHGPHEKMNKITFYKASFCGWV